MIAHQGQNAAIKKYIRYMKMRIKILNVDLVISTGNEIKFYQTLLSRVQEWSESHKVYYKYMLGTIDISDVTKMFGVSTRTSIRMMNTQRKELLSNIEKWETELQNRFPFEVVQARENFAE